MGIIFYYIVLTLLVHSTVGSGNPATLHISCTGSPCFTVNFFAPTVFEDPVAPAVRTDTILAGSTKKKKRRKVTRLFITPRVLAADAKYKGRWVIICTPSVVGSINDHLRSTAHTNVHTCIPPNEKKKPKNHCIFTPQPTPDQYSINTVR